MVENPQLMIPQIERANLAKSNLSVDAIFIPFRKRHEYVNTLLQELYWYKGSIFLMPSRVSEMNNIPYCSKQNVYELRIEEQTFFVEFYKRLLTSRHRLTAHHAVTWDLPLKRSYALWYSTITGLDRILLVDDDIRGLSPQILSAGSELVDRYSISGCFVEAFPDTSILGHLQCATGENANCFLSGSFLFVKVCDIQEFFPNIYNEDWLFMLPHVLNGSACSFGSIAQEVYDPFSNPGRASFQEFGDILAEGLYTLVNMGSYDRRFQMEFWDNEIMERRKLLLLLSVQFTQLKHRKVISAALHANSLVQARDCSEFINNWEADLISWQAFLQERNKYS